MVDIQYVLDYVAHRYKHSLFIYNISRVWYSAGAQEIGHVVPSKPGFLGRGGGVTVHNTGISLHLSTS